MTRHFNCRSFKIHGVCTSGHGKLPIPSALRAGTLFNGQGEADEMRIQPMPYEQLESNGALNGFRGDGFRKMLHWGLRALGFDNEAEITFLNAIAPARIFVGANLAF